MGVGFDVDCEQEYVLAGKGIKQLAKENKISHRLVIAHLHASGMPVRASNRPVLGYPLYARQGPGRPPMVTGEGRTFLRCLDDLEANTNFSSWPDP